VTKLSQNSSRAPIIYLPIEFQVREFESKCLLAATLARQGYSVVLGQQWMLYANIDRLPLGVFLFKSFNKIHHPAMIQAKRTGHRVVTLEEELLAQIDDKAVAAFCTEGLFEIPDLILANGRFEHDILKHLSGGKVRIEVTGNGRVDILKPHFRSLFRKQIEAIRLQCGEFVLVNTNFAVRNSIWQSLEQVTEIQIQAGFIKPGDLASEKMWEEYLAFEDANISAMHEAIRELARRRPSQKIVVRPHPGEDLKRWEGVFPNYPNIAVIREGAHIPWTLASRLLLHTSCTTGFEAFIAGKTALSLVPSGNWYTDCLISNRVNPIFEEPGDLVAEVDKILDGALPPTYSPKIDVEKYIWNWSDNDGTRRIAELLVEGLVPSQPVALPSLQNVILNDKLREKFNVSLKDCVEMFQRIAEATKGEEKLNLCLLGESLFFISSWQVAMSAPTPPKFDAAQLLAAMESAMQARNFESVHAVFKKNFGEAYRYPDLCFIAGIAVSELGKYELALQYFEAATVAGSQTVNYNLAFSLAKTHERLRDPETAWRYAELAYRMVPTEPKFFDLFKQLSAQTGRKVPEHWLVIGCSHVRYFRYMQINQPKFFEGSVHLECHEFGGATAYGLGNPTSDSGTLNATRQLRPRIAEADRVIVNFGEIDCRRAAWKAAAVSGRSIEETIAESAAHLETYVVREILPFNKNVLLLGAKPQIIADDDFYKNSLVDERTIFKPLPEREKITLAFNAKVRASAERLNVDYADIDDVMEDEKSRRRFLESAFWDTYTDDTHGNVDSFAALYFARLKPFIRKSRKPQKH
jgi:surface carbohydrate biosynthesis protein